MIFGVCRPSLYQLDPRITGGKDFELFGPRLRLRQIPGAQRKLGQGFDQGGIAAIELMGAGEGIISIVIAAHRRLHFAELGPIFGDIVLRADQFQQRFSRRRQVIRRSCRLIFPESRSCP